MPEYEAQEETEDKLELKRKCEISIEDRVKKMARPKVQKETRAPEGTEEGLALPPPEEIAEAGVFYCSQQGIFHNMSTCPVLVARSLNRLPHTARSSFTGPQQANLKDFPT